MIMLGVGAGLVIPSATSSVMGSVPAEHTGVGAATNGAFLQVGGALGVAIIGSLMNTGYQERVTAALAPFHVPHDILGTITGSLGGALSVAAHLGGSLGTELASVARSAFISGMDLGLTVAAGVVLLGAVLALVWLPDYARPAGRPPAADAGDESPGSARDHRLCADGEHQEFDRSQDGAGTMAGDRLSSGA
jgi:hypothetical protein